ncbi:MAG: hypothetical protein J6N49_00325 [Alphaproteobacteria bacterium]|nr:hypothetical protein [Alphaproteobacteria bacterium]
MGFKEFYLKNARSYPMSVAKTAYGYTLRQHDVKPALSTAATLYAAKLEDRRLYHTGYTITDVNNHLTVYRLQTETLSALNRLSANDFREHRYPVSARLGENCRFTPLAEFYPENGQYLGIYGHRNRYVSIVRIQSEQEAENLCKTADVIAQNVMAAYTDYVYKTRRTQEFNKQISPIIKQTSLVGNSLEHFLNERLYMVHNKYGSATLAEFIDGLNKQFNLSIKITEIHIFGL